MNFEHVDSSNLNGVFYDTETSTLYIKFKDESIYEYYDVPDYVYRELMGADSKGKYAHQNIYKNFHQNRIN